MEEILSGSTAYVLPDEAERGRAFFEAALRGEPQQFESAILHKDGHRVDVSATEIPIVVDGEVVGVFGIARDITELRKANEERDRLLQDLADAQQRVHDVLSRVLRPAQHQARAERRADLEARIALLTSRELDVLRLLGQAKLLTFAK